MADKTKAEEIRLSNLNTLNKHFIGKSRFTHLEDEQVRLVLDAMDELYNSRQSEIDELTKEVKRLRKENERLLWQVRLPDTPDFKEEHF